ncbi:G1/S-specific cyclin Pcl5 [Aspergillus steynii IBT 23096]|uniref:G1/S-specific cyclin Pcl5 n=1 Tax=Aspergillus steynii IBT 23096 TaxID=1392250 RepID=A0A2I2G8F8_9EURO|nr:G1/S-specific cyclin Pcl5 [Aspergillus steynii IBT 23096]PLB49161.1 G1/S-specific cyclin Pcl5 [Aspergillus steynii IBT 23096]
MTGIDVLGLKDPNPGLSYKTSYAHPYPSSSVSSSASSSSSSVFSLDGLSTQGSTSSTSTNPADVIWEHDGEFQAGRGPASLQGPRERACLRAPVPKPADVPVAPELRKHPRRTGVQAANDTAASARPPPCLMRQSERKVNFVDNLVDTASQIVEIIWPLSAVSLRSDSATGCKGVLPLRTFIQETLRRSRTSYSTLQVALYYLIKIKPHVPSHDLTQDQTRSKPVCRAMQCGRRMFLAALILASKYLQDRNYSARAWSKISGLNTVEINQNELMFLQAVDWKLHITEATFQRWTDIVLKYTPGAGALALEGYSWRTVIPRLTPDLEEVDVAPMTPPASVEGYDVRSMADSPSPRGTSTRGGFASYPSSYPAGEPCVLPSLSERIPESRTVDSFNPSLPSIPRPPMLPTPQMTPQSSMASTPAASAGSYPPHRRNICAAMSQVQNMCMARSTLDQRPSLPFCPKASNGSFDGYPTMVRRSSLARSTSSASSPDSMISDVSTLSSQSSRSSSMSSASGSGGVVLPRLAVQAALRSTNNTMKENRKPLAIASPIDETSLSDIYHSSPLDGYGAPPTAVPDLSNFTLGTPVDMSSTHEAAQGLCALSGAAASRQPHAAGSQRHSQGRKRGRAGSEDFPLQNHVRHLIHSTAIREGTVLPDGKMADLFLNSGPRRSQSLTATQLNALNSYAPLSGPVGMKRACCGSEANKIALNPTMRAEYLG